MCGVVYYLFRVRVVYNFLSLLSGIFLHPPFRIGIDRS
jgi:hypothetical protein